MAAATANRTNRSRKDYTTIMRQVGKQPRILVLEALSGSSQCVAMAQGHAVTVGATDAVGVSEALIGGVCGVVLTGGSDVNPALYDEKPHPSVYGINRTRDSVEYAVLDAARAMKIPVLGICRGAQLMTVWAGGSLWQDIGQAHWGVQHKIRTKPNSVARVALGIQPKVQSFHHQEVKEPGAGFVVTANALDKCATVEAVENASLRMLGVQFHPEMARMHDHSKRVFAWLVCEAMATEPGKVPGAVLDKLEAIEAPRIPKIPRPRKLTKAEKRSMSDRFRERSVKTILEENLVCSVCCMAFEDIADRLDHEDFVH